MEKKRLTVRLDPEIYEELRFIRSCTRYISMNTHINIALKKYIKEWFESHPHCKKMRDEENR